MVTAKEIKQIKEMEKIKENVKVEIENPKGSGARLIEVPTQVGLMIELEDGKRVNELELLVILYNELKEIKRVLALLN